MDLFDSHIHLHRLPLGDQLAPDTKWALVPAITPDDWSGLINTYGQRSEVYLALGVHPQYARQWNRQLQTELSLLSQRPDVVAIGETGLDARFSDEGQATALRQQVGIALNADKALILHCHKRYAALIDLLQQEQAQQVGGIIHGYTGSVEIARQLWQLGFVIGVGRTILNPQARRLRSTLAALPDAAYVIETDAPWPPHILKHHADTAQGAGALRHIVEQVAHLRGQTLEHVARVSETNTRRILNIATPQESD